MVKTILLTGATDGIGFETAKKLVANGHNLLIHGRSPAKLNQVLDQLNQLSGAGEVEGYLADLSDLSAVATLAAEVKANQSHIDVLINNAGIFKTPNPITANGQDIRFVVNTLAPYLLTQQLMPLMNSSSRVVNLSSAAQAPVDLDALSGKKLIGEEFSAYAQSKLAITIWSREMAKTEGPAVIAVNPGSLLASKMVKEGFGVVGKDLSIGADILIRAALSDEFASASGKYFDNDSGQFADPHPEVFDPVKVRKVMDIIQQLTV